MLRLVVVMLVVALCRAGSFSCCSKEDREEVQAIWGGVWSADHTGTRLQVAKAIFEDFLDREPDARNTFVNVGGDDLDSPAFQAHSLRVLNGLDTAIGLFNDVKTLQLQLEHLAGQHAARAELGVKPEYFEVFGRSLLKVLPQVAGCFNVDAFTRCYAGIAAKLGSQF